MNRILLSLAFASTIWMSSCSMNDSDRGDSTITVLVRDRDDGNTRSATVTLLGVSPDTQETDDEGYVRFKGLNAGQYALEVQTSSCPHSAIFKTGVEGEPEEEVLVYANIKLCKSYIKGMVFTTDTNGTQVPMTSGSVIATLAPQDGFDWKENVLTTDINEDGSYLFQFVPNGVEVSITAQNPLYSVDQASQRANTVSVISGESDRMATAADIIIDTTNIFEE